MTILMRLIALFLILAALVLLGMDAVSSLERGGEITVRSAGMIWLLIHPDSLIALRTGWRTMSRRRNRRSIRRWKCRAGA